MISAACNFISCLKGEAADFNRICTRRKEPERKGGREEITGQGPFFKKSQGRDSK